MARRHYDNPVGREGPGERRDALPVVGGVARDGGGGDSANPTVLGFRGRGAAINPGNRFEKARLFVVGEFWDEELAANRETASAAGEKRAGDGRPRLPTIVYRDDTRSVVNPVTSPDVGACWSLNPYRGCEHGCIYCYARPFHELIGFSCGLDFETRLMAKVDAAELLRQELAKPAWKGEPISMALATDCYQPVERKLRITRGCLEVMAECRQPVAITTKSRLVVRDADLLRDLAAHQAAQVAISLTTLDPHLAAKLEPRASSPAERLRALAQLRAAGVPVLVLNAPVIPGLTDRETPAVLKAAGEAGAQAAGFELLRLPGQVQALFVDWLARQLPERASHVENLIRQTHGGELDEIRFFERFRGKGPIAQQIQRTFKVFRKRCGLDGELPELSSAAFRRPALGGQMRLFDG